MSLQSDLHFDCFRHSRFECVPEVTITHVIIPCARAVA